jgi:biotin operon repressor
VNDSIEKLQTLVKSVLTDTPLTAQEIADKTGGSIMMVRLAMPALEKQGYAISMGARPIRYCAAKIQTKSGQRHREEYRGEPKPYLRPGSYTPLARPRITLAGIVIESLSEINC